MTDILVAEDSTFQRHKLAGSLHPDDEIVATASTGREAVRAAEQHDPDVILMDIIMPELDGIDAISQIRARGVSAPVILCTTVTQTEKMKRAIVAGADDYLEKPYDSEELTRKIESVVNA